MTIVRIDKKIIQRVKTQDGLWKSMNEFIECCKNGTVPPRIYKPSGIAADGTTFDPYLRLNLHHHHLHRRGDPLLVTQHVEDVIQSVALSNHAEYLLGDKLEWLRTHADAINWDGCDDVFESLFEDGSRRWVG